MIKLPAIFLALTTCLSTSAIAKNIEASISGGIDSNPLLLQDAFSPQSAFFINSDIGFAHRLDSGLGFKANWTQRFYEGDSSDADRRTLSAGVNFRKPGNLFGKKVRYKADISFTDFDRTYISRITGLTGSFGGNPLPDRFDSNWVNAKMGVEFFINDKFRLEFAAAGRTRSYHDYTDIGVSNLDHDQWSMRTKLTFKPDAKNEITGYYRFLQRNFDDREGKALDRSSVPGSSLKYDYHIMEATWEYDFAKRHSLKAFAYLEKRTDNVSGFYDTTWKRLRLRYRNKISKTQKLEAIITYRDYAYDNNDTFNAIEGEEPINSKKGFEYKLSYAHRLSSSDSMSWWIVADGAYGNFDSVNASYIYDQAVIHVGLQLDF